MIRNEIIKLLEKEFTRWEVHFETRELNSGHIEVRWQVSPDKEIRRFVVAKTPSDYRAPMNDRATVRRLLRADGLTLKEPDRPIPIIHKALSVPKHVETDTQHLQALRDEVVELTDLMLEIAGTVSNFKEWVLARESAVAPALPGVAMIGVAPSGRGIKTIDFVSANWNSTDALAHAMGVSKVIAIRKLTYLLKQEKVERSAGQWRRKPETQPQPIPKLKLLTGNLKGVKTNGKSIHHA